jgi:hypothetical protein
MLSLERELEALRPALGDARTDALLARERREIFSVHPELRVCAWLGATLLATAAGIVLKNNYERIGPLALAILIGIAAAACYAWTWRRRAVVFRSSSPPTANRQPSTVVDDYVLLLGALLVSADVAFVESQFHLLDENWKHHLIVLAIVHAVGAYAYGSRMLLSMAIVALAGWIGFDRELRAPKDLVVPAFATAIVLLGWREADRRRRSSEEVSFSRTLEHFAANAALLGGLAVSARNETLGALVTVGMAALVIAWGFRTRHEPFVLYAFVYAVIATDIMLTELVDDSESAVVMILLLSMIAAVVGLLVLHARFTRGAAGFSPPKQP